EIVLPAMKPAIEQPRQFVVAIEKAIDQLAEGLVCGRIYFLKMEISTAPEKPAGWNQQLAGECRIRRQLVEIDQPLRGTSPQHQHVVGNVRAAPLIKRNGGT